MKPLCFWIATLALTGGVATPRAFAAEDISSCEAALLSVDSFVDAYLASHPTYLVSRLERPVHYGFELQALTSHATPEFRKFLAGSPASQLTEIHFLEGGREVGRVTYIASETEAYIDLMQVDPRDRGRGVSRALLALGLQAHPQLRRINADFDDDNLAAYDDALDRGASPEAAVKQTPFYKAHATFGFTRIAVVEETLVLYSRMIRVALERE